MNIPYTFYGDLLGISNYYKLDPETAYEKLDKFYAITYRNLSNYCHNNSNVVNVNMFSDSILIYGDNAKEILVKLCSLYVNLVSENLLLRGAIVDGKLQYDERIELNNFQKKLPYTNLLAMAVGLEKSVKGSRLLIDKRLAKKLLNGQLSSWLTIDGYLDNYDIQSDISSNDILRKICLTPNHRCYELLYFWNYNEFLHDNNLEKKLNLKDKLKEIAKMSDSTISKQYNETIALLDRSFHREQYTKKRLGE